MLKLIRSLALPDQLHCCAVSADGRRVVACSKSGACYLFDQELRELDQMGPQAKVEWVQLNDDGSLLLLGFSDHIDGYNLAGGISRLLTFPIAGTSLFPCVFSSHEPVVCIASWDRDPIL